MCELLGMSANVPTDICFSFAGLIQRGGKTGPHKDGWGISFYEGLGCRSFLDAKPSVDSTIAEFVCNYPIKSNVVISHIRQANVGEVCLANTQPFIRELWGRSWSFAHNGQMNTVFDEVELGRYHPIGTTDSEHAFCWLLDQIEKNFDGIDDNLETVAQFIREHANTLAALGVFNMLLSESEYLFCYCTTKLHWITRRAPFGEASLKDADISIDFVKETGADDVVSIIATEPLTQNEQWHTIEAGELIVFRQGEKVLSLTS